MGAYMRFPGGKSKALTLSYDDGVRQDKRLVKILDKYGIKATFNINSGCYSDIVDHEVTNGRMSEQEVYELFKDSPHEVAVHGYEHGYDEILPNNLMANEILQDRINVEKLTGKIVHNPTATDVWFVNLPWGECTPIKVEAGKTIRL